MVNPQGTVVDDVALDGDLEKNGGLFLHAVEAMMDEKKELRWRKHWRSRQLVDVCFDVERRLGLWMKSGCVDDALDVVLYQHMGICVKETESEYHVVGIDDTCGLEWKDFGGSRLLKTVIFLDDGSLEGLSEEHGAKELYSLALALLI
jgi:hypothetical protein